MKQSSIIFFLLCFFFTQSYSQSGAVLGVGLSLANTDNPALNKNGSNLSGWHASLTARLGKNFWYLKPGIEVHNIKLESTKMVDPFSEEASAYYLKIPCQIGARIVRLEKFMLRASAGIIATYLLSIEDNNLFLDHNTMTDFQLGLGGGVGIDLGPLTLDINYEKGMTELFKGKSYKLNVVSMTLGFFF